MLIGKFQQSCAFIFLLFMMVIEGGNDATSKTPDASDVYDRQIRLWGKEAQQKMSKAKVLYIHVSGVSTEILKNLVLAGIRATICDNRPYPEAVLDNPSFLLPAGAIAKDPKEDEGEPATKKAKTEEQTVAEALKPVVEGLNRLLGPCPIVNKSIEEMINDPEFLKEYPIVIASRCGLSDSIKLAQATAKVDGKFILTDTFGYDGAAILDLGPDHSYRPELGKTLLDPRSMDTYIPLPIILREIKLSEAVNRFHKSPPPVWLKYRAILEYHEKCSKWPSKDTAVDFSKVIREWLQQHDAKLLELPCLQDEALQELATVASAELVPVCAVVGGILGNEVIKAISGKGEPANNTILFDGDTCKAWTFLVKPKS